MGKLLLFTGTNRPESAHVARDTDAELVVFPGVRYERQETQDDNRSVKEQQREKGA